MRALRLCAVAIFAFFAVHAIPVTDTIEPEIRDIFEHLEALQKIADVHGSRAVAAGYNDSAAYVTEQLKLSGFDVAHQYFVVPVHTELELPNLSFPYSSPEIKLHVCQQRTGWQRFEVSCDYAGVRYGGSGKHDITSTLHYVGDGCKPESFAGFPKGKIALIDTGVCEYFDKAANAEDAGASAIVLVQVGGVAGTPGGRAFIAPTWREGNRVIHIPIVGVTSAVGSTLRQDANIVIRFQTNSKIDLITTLNVIAETKGGDKNKIVTIGAHLDGVPEGPGINDNGSGTSTVLAIAKRLAHRSFKNTIRFGWWGAEEIGLLGSYHYVRDLVENHPDDLSKIVAYLNFDMEASPNYIRLIYNGTEAGVAREGSEKLMRKFEEHFRGEGLSFALTSMGGGSDFLPFILAGVPASGLAAGASGLKSAGEREQHKGLANTQLDPCYHASCDSIANVSPQCISETSHAAEKILVELANDADLQAPANLSPKAILEKLALSADVSSCFSDEEQRIDF